MRRWLLATIASLALAPYCPAQSETETADKAAPAGVEAEDPPDDDAAMKPAAAIATKEPHSRLLGPLQVGASTAIEIPHLLNYSLDTLWDKSIGGSFSWGHIHRKMNEVDAEMMNWDVRVRWFPWQSAFFLGGIYGKQTLAAKTKKDLSFDFQGNELIVPTAVKIQVETTYLTPHLGWIAHWDCGLSLGFELGYQLALSAKAKTTTGFENVSPSVENEVKNTADYKDAEESVTKLGDTIGKKNLPYLALLRIGFML